MSYATTDDVKSYLNGVDLAPLGDETAQDDAIDAAAAVGTALVEQFTRRKFESTTATKSFDGTGTSRLFIPDLLTLSAWTLDGQTRSISELLLYPLSVAPAQWLYRTAGIFSEGRGNIALTGTWGYSASAPATVVSATAQLSAAELFLRLMAAKDAGATDISQGSLSERYTGGAYGEEVRRLTHAAESLLIPYRRPYVG